MMREYYIWSLKIFTMTIKTQQDSFQAAVRNVSSNANRQSLKRYKEILLYIDIQEC